jgi:hypothetical protein
VDLSFFIDADHAARLQQRQRQTGDESHVASATVSAAAGVCGCVFRCNSIKSFSGIRDGSLFASMAAKSKRTLLHTKNKHGAGQLWQPRSLEAFPLCLLKVHLQFPHRKNFTPGKREEPHPLRR